MKTVVTSAQVFHLWANQSQDYARNGTGTVYFRGPTVYSYRDTWPLATIYSRTVRGPDSQSRVERLVLANCDTYSVTTSHHQACANRAVDAPVIEVPFPDGAAEKRSGAYAHDGNLEYLAKQMHGALAKAGRRMSERTVKWDIVAARRHHNEHARYLAFFRIRRKPLAFPEDTAAAALDRIHRIEHPDPAREAKLAKAREQRQAREQRRLQSQFDAYMAAVAEYNAQDPESVWRATGRFPVAPPYLNFKVTRKLRAAGFTLPEYPRSGSELYSRRILLRVQGDEIVTSAGARIPLSHAPRIWRLIERVRVSGQPYTRNGHTEHAGSFAIDSVDVNGTLKAGCHTICYDEMRRLAIALGYAVGDGVIIDSSGTAHAPTVQS